MYISYISIMAVHSSVFCISPISQLWRYIAQCFVYKRYYCLCYFIINTYLVVAGCAARCRAWQHARRCRRRPGRHVILLMMQRTFCFFLKVYGFLWCFHIDILSGLSIFLLRCHVLCYFIVLYTHTYDIFYVCHMHIWFYERFVRNDEIKLWNHWFRQWPLAWPTQNHYLNQYWNTVNWTLKTSSQ